MGFTHALDTQYHHSPELESYSPYLEDCVLTKPQIEAVVCESLGLGEVFSRSKFDGSIMKEDRDILDLLSDKIRLKQNLEQRNAHEDTITNIQREIQELEWRYIEQSLELVVNAILKHHYIHTRFGVPLEDMISIGVEKLFLAAREWSQREYKSEPSALATERIVRAFRKLATQGPRTMIQGPPPYKKHREGAIPGVCFSAPVSLIVDFLRMVQDFERLQESPPPGTTFSQPDWSYRELADRYRQMLADGEENNTLDNEKRKFLETYSNPVAIRDLLESNSIIMLLSDPDLYPAEEEHRPDPFFREAIAEALAKFCDETGNSEAIEQALWLHYGVEERSLREISELLGTPKDSLRSIMQSALRFLRKRNLGLREFMES